MADPTKYEPHFNYSGWEAAGNKRPKPGAELDIDFANIARSVDETIDALKDIRRSDGKLKNGIVGPDAFDEAARDLIAGTSAQDAAEEAREARDEAAEARDEAAEARDQATNAAQEATDTVADTAKKTANLSDLTNLKEARSNLGTFSTVADVQNSHIPPVLDSIRTNGYYTPGDGGGALYKRVAIEPSHAGKIQSADGTWWELTGTAVNAYQFGAIGDGLANDTAKLAAMFTHPAKFFRIPRGRFAVLAHTSRTPSINVERDEIIVSCDGEITVTERTDKAIRFTGSRNIIQLNVAGENLLAYAVEVYGDHNEISGCRIRDLWTDDYSAIAIKVRASNGGGGNIVRNNRIEMVNSVGDGSTGDGNGMSRAISYDSLEGDAGYVSLIENNYISGVIGEEGDAIQTLASTGNGSQRYASRLIIRNNTIYRFTRRAVKVQAHDVTIENNYIDNSYYTEAAQVPNLQNAISIIQGSDIIIRGNRLHACKFQTQISVYHANTDEHDFSDNIYVGGNIMTGYGAETSQSAISIISWGKNIVVEGNIMQCSAGRALVLGNNKFVVVRDNIVHNDSVNSDVLCQFAGSNEEVSVEGNVFFGETATAVFNMNSPAAVVSGNKSFVTAPFYRRTSEQTTGQVFAHNYSKGILSVGAGASADVYWMGHLSNQTESNRAPSVIHRGSTTSLGSLPVARGQVVLNNNPQAGGNIGWVSLSDGTADTVTWKEFGPIDS